MHPFPFSQSDWQLVVNISTEIVNASAMEDEVLCASRIADMEELLEVLGKRYGEHPVLLETLADSLRDYERQVALYTRARDLAVREGLPTYTIRISFARVLVEAGRNDEARTELLACQCEVADCADEWERKEWAELMVLCK